MADLRPGFDILDADDSRRMVKRVMKAMHLASSEEDGAGGRDPLRLVCNRISKWEDELVTPAEAPAAAESLIAQANAGRFAVDPPSLRAAARVYAEYQRAALAEHQDWFDQLAVMRAQIVAKAGEILRSHGLAVAAP